MKLWKCYKAWRTDFGRWRSFRNAFYACYLLDPFGRGQRRMERVYQRDGIEGLRRELQR